MSFRRHGKIDRDEFQKQQKCGMITLCARKVINFVLICIRNIHDRSRQIYQDWLKPIREIYGWFWQDWDKNCMSDQDTKHLGVFNFRRIISRDIANINLQIIIKVIVSTNMIVIQSCYVVGMISERVIFLIFFF